MPDFTPHELCSNPALLKLDLYCKGARMDGSCFVEEDGGRKVLRTRAGLGSGLELILSGGLWTNVPVSERFALGSPYALHRAGGRYVLYRDGEEVTPVELSPRPAWQQLRRQRPEDPDRAAAGEDRRGGKGLIHAWSKPSSGAPNSCHAEAHLRAG